MRNQDDSRNERFGRERNPVEIRGTRTFPTKSPDYEVGTRASAASSRAGPTRHLCRRSQAAAVGDGLFAEIDTDDGVVIVAGDQSFGCSHEAYSHAANSDSLRSLVSNGLAERESESSLRITEKGLAYVRTAEAHASAENDVNPVEFEPIKILGIIDDEV
jgi:hypothetical protein